MLSESITELGLFCGSTNISVGKNWTLESKLLDKWALAGKTPILTACISGRGKEN